MFFRGLWHQACNLCLSTVLRQACTKSFLRSEGRCMLASSGRSAANRGLLARWITKQAPVILQEDVQGLGSKGELVQVAPGFARNHLHPLGLVIYPTNKELKAREQQQDSKPDAAQPRRVQVDTAAAVLARVVQRLEAKPVVLHTTASRPGFLDAPVSAKSLARAVRRQMDVQLSPALLNVPAGLSRAGTHTVHVQILRGEGQSVQLTLKIERMPDRRQPQQAPSQAA